MTIEKFNLIKLNFDRCFNLLGKVARGKFCFLLLWGRISILIKHRLIFWGFWSGSKKEFLIFFLVDLNVTECNKKYIYSIKFLRWILWKSITCLIPWKISNKIYHSFCCKISLCMSIRIFLITTKIPMNNHWFHF